MKMIKTIIRKEWKEIFQNRIVLFSVVFLPLFLVALQLFLLNTTRGGRVIVADGESKSPKSLVCQFAFTGEECAQASMISQFILMFMILPVTIPVTIAAHSIAGEKATRSLEPLLATPISSTELLIGKGLSAIIPGTLATFIAYILYAIGARILTQSRIVLAIFLEPRWLIAIFLVGPLMAVMAVIFCLMVSSKVANPRAAEQISALIVLPSILLFLSQMAGLILLDQQIILAVAAGLTILDGGLIFLLIRVFRRETILTRWA